MEIALIVALLGKRARNQKNLVFLLDRKYNLLVARNAVERQRLGRTWIHQIVPEVRRLVEGNAMNNEDNYQVLRFSFV